MLSADMLLRLERDKPEAIKRLDFCNSYSRLGTLIAMWAGMAVEHDEWLALLGDLWEICDNIGDHIDELQETPLWDVLEGTASGRLLMNAAELADFDALPDDVPVYRGCYANNKWGLSWTTDRDRAARFPFLHRYRQDGQALLVQAVATKPKIAALKLGRNEAEIITWKPRHVATSLLSEPLR